MRRSQFSHLDLEFQRLDLRLFRNLQRIIHFNAQVPNGAFQLRVTTQQLNCTDVLGALVDQGRLGSTQRVRAISRLIEADASGPGFHDSAVLAK